jgi:hypothetical protein
MRIGGEVNWCGSEVKSSKVKGKQSEKAKSGGRKTVSEVERKKRRGGKKKRNPGRSVVGESGKVRLD